MVLHDPSPDAPARLRKLMQPLIDLKPDTRAFYDVAKAADAEVSRGPLRLCLGLLLLPPLLPRSARHAQLLRRPLPTPSLPPPLRPPFRSPPRRAWACTTRPRV